MKLTTAFVSSFKKISDLPTDGRPEIAFIGRSNVGKSSLINAFAGKKQLAKVSSTPGKTQLLNYFDVNGTFYLVDMPGYGFAKVSKGDRQEWGKIAEEYFLRRKELKAVAILIDSRHPALPNDIEVVEWFSERNLPFFLVLTKSDKPKQAEVVKHERLLKENISTAIGVLRTSSETGRGIHELREFLFSIVNKEKNQES